MKTIREQFEEIWPVPDNLYWSNERGEYRYMGCFDQPWASEFNIRLDTFTRCQETTAIHLSLIDDLVNELEFAYSFLPRGKTYSTDALDRAKQIMEQKK